MVRCLQGRARLAALIALVFGATATATALAGESSLGEVDGVEYWKDSTTFTAPSGQNRPVPCPAGTKVTGGGFSQSALSGSANDSFPFDGGDPGDDPDDGWDANVQFEGSGTHTLTVFAICTQGKRSYRDKEQQLDAGTTRKLEAKCAADTHVIGGGAVIFGPIDAALLNSSYPFDSNDAGKAPDDGWRARGVNLSGGGLAFVVVAICAKQEPVYRSEETTLVPSTSSGISAFCPNSKQVLSGGIRLTGPGPEAQVHALYPSDGGDGNAIPDDGFLANGENLPGSAEAKQLTGYAICG